MDLKEVNKEIVQSKHWYYSTKSIPLIRFVSQILEREKKAFALIDVGAGTGFFSKMLEEKFGDRISKIILVDVNYTDEEVSKALGKRIEKTKYVPEQLNNCIILMMDVLEHIEDDNSFIKNIIHKTSGTNYFFVTVPAFMSLWSNHDEYLLHKRRYSLKQISSTLENQGINVYSKYYLYFFLFPYAYVFRKYFQKKDRTKNDMRSFSFLINKILQVFFSLEMVFRKLNRVAGLSCCIEGKTIQR